MFREDHKIETITRQNWRNLIKVRKNDAELNLLKKCILLMYDDLADTKKLHPSSKILTSHNMYIAIWRTLNPVPKEEIISYLSKIIGDGSNLRFILTLYHGIAEQIIHAQQKKIENFSKIMELYKGDIDKVCEYFQNPIQLLFAPGGTDEQVFDRIDTAFTETHVIKLNQEM